MSRAPRVVAIDGPAGTGKSTVARAVARRLGLPYVDTGAMYRALGWLALERGIDPDDPAAAAALAESARLDVRLEPDGAATVLLEGEPVEPWIRSRPVAEATSRLAVHAAVRDRLIALQRRLVGEHGGVLEGRDIGTRVLPDAPHKFFLTARADVRARRRLADLPQEADPPDETAVRREIEERDERDRSRAVSPLVRARDAVEIDTSERSVEEVVDALLAAIGSSDPDPG